MYACEERPDVLCGAMADIRFGASAVATAGESSSHIPMIVKRGDDGTVSLDTHVGRAPRRPRWRPIMKANDAQGAD